LVRSADQPGWYSASPDTILKENDGVKTDQNSQAFLRLFDYSTVVVYSGSELQLERLAASRYAPQRDALVLRLVRGKARLAVAPSLDSQKRFEVRVRGTTIDLDEGIFTVNVEDAGAQVRVQERGRAMVTSQGEAVQLAEGQRTEIRPDAPPTPPEKAQQDLIMNGDFSQGLDGWVVREKPGFSDGQDVAGATTLLLEDERPAIRFARRGSKGSHNESYIYQEIDRDVSDFSSLRLVVRLKLQHQSLSGGGYMGSEYPLLVRVDYRTQTGEVFKVWGLYYQNEANNRTDDGFKVPQGPWQEFSSLENLMTMTPRPQRILSMTVGASGWDYESLISSVGLVGE